MDEIADYLDPYPPVIQSLAEALRGLIKQAVPGCTEKVYRGWQLIGYRAPAGKGSRYFAYVAPFDDRVVLGFEWGVLLADEDGRLQGDGSQVRTLVFGDTADLQANDLIPLIQEAAAVALLSKDAKANLALQRRAERERP